MIVGKRYIFKAAAGFTISEVECIFKLPSGNVVVHRPEDGHEYIVRPYDFGKYHLVKEKTSVWANIYKKNEIGGTHKSRETLPKCVDTKAIIRLDLEDDVPVHCEIETI